MNDITAIIVFFAVFRIFGTALKVLFGAVKHNDLPFPVGGDRWFRRDR